MRICQDYMPDDIFIAGFVCKLFSQERHGRFDAISSTSETRDSGAHVGCPPPRRLTLRKAAQIREHPIETQARPTKPNRICLEALPVLTQHRSLPNKEQLPTAKFNHVLLLKALGETTCQTLRTKSRTSTSFNRMSAQVLNASPPEVRELLHCLCRALNLWLKDALLFGRTGPRGSVSDLWVFQCLGWLGVKDSYN